MRKVTVLNFFSCAVACTGFLYSTSSLSVAQQNLPATSSEEPLLEPTAKPLINDLNQSGKAPSAVIKLNNLEQKFSQLMTGAKLTGMFTVEGKPMNDLVQDTYEIRKVEKSKPEGDSWIITARVKYGKNDYEMPFPIDVKWAGDTPVLTLEKLAVPGLGVFSCRVVLHGNKYAGTWQHNDKGGHMFGNISFASESESKP